jgi:hypothetical protein
MANTFPSSGNVGIGTADPKAQLDVRGSGDSLILISDTTNGSRLLIGTDAQLPRFLRIRPQSGDGVAITNDGDKIAVFVRASDGNVGVGTTDPEAALHVEGFIRSTDISVIAFDGKHLSVAPMLEDLFRRVGSLEGRVLSLEAKVPQI